MRYALSDTTSVSHTMPSGRQQQAPRAGNVNLSAGSGPWPPYHTAKTIQAVQGDKETNPRIYRVRRRTCETLQRCLWLVRLETPEENKKTTPREVIFGGGSEVPSPILFFFKSRKAGCCKYCGTLLSKGRSSASDIISASSYTVGGGLQEYITVDVHEIIMWHRQSKNPIAPMGEIDTIAHWTRGGYSLSAVKRRTSNGPLSPPQ